MAKSTHGPPKPVIVVATMAATVIVHGIERSM